MLKFKLYYDKDEEEAWLKKMCSSGWAFKKFFLGFYTFEPCEPGEYTYQIDLLDNWSGNKVNYSIFMNDVGIEVIGQWWRWVYLKKNSSDGPFELYTDVESKINHYSKIRSFFKVALVIEIICFFMELAATINTGYYLFGIFTALLGVLCFALLNLISKLKSKIQQFKLN